jgi:hypothetical protein
VGVMQAAECVQLCIHNTSLEQTGAMNTLRSIGLTGILATVHPVTLSTAPSVLVTDGMVTFLATRYRPEKLYSFEWNAGMVMV